MPDRDPIVGPLEVQLGDDGSRMVGVDGQCRFWIKCDHALWYLWTQRVDGTGKGERLIATFRDYDAMERFCAVLGLARAELLKPEMA